jgi:Putative  PD-(D/E)XK family member, (DUF4420)
VSAELVDQIRLGWVVLSEAGAPEASDVRTHPLTGSWFLGVGAGGTPCLLTAVAEPGPEEREGAVTIVNRELDSDDGRCTFVVIACGEPSLRDVFDHFATAVVEAHARSADRHPAATALVVLARWRALFRPAGNALGPGELAALLAELLVLAEIVERDARRSVAVWTGPDGARHDLRRGSTAIEVKATLSHTAREAGINGIDQLEAPAGGSLTLAWHRLERAEDGPFSVFGLADRIIAAGAQPEQLYGLLEQAGSPPSLREAHDAVRFDLRERGFFAVEDGFPRIVTASFPSGPPAGVDDLSYVVTLPPAQASLSEAETEELLQRMAGLP